MTTVTDNSFQPLLSLENLTHLRVTQVGKLLECPRQWKAILLGEGETGENKWSAIGTAVHLCIEHFLRGTFSLFSLDWQREMLRLEAAGVSAVERGHLLRYLISLERWRAHVFALETECAAELVLAAPLIKGHIDCIFQPYEGLMILRDHKTNRHYKPVDWWARQWQPRLYAWLARQRWPELTHRVVFEIGYVNIPGEVVRWEPDPLDWFALESAYHEAWAEVQGSLETGHWREQKNENCAYCPVRLDCPTSRAATRMLFGSLADRLRKELK